MRILLAISDIKLAHRIKERFTVEKSTIMIIENGDDVLPRLKGFNPDLLIIDIILPNKSGYDILDEKSYDREITKIPVIILSNSGDPIHMKKIPSTPTIRDFIVSSYIDIEELLKKVKRIV